MPTLRERLAAWEAEKADLLERLETLQTRLDQSPGQQQMTNLQSEMKTLRGELATAQAKLDAIPTQTPLPTPSPASEDGTLPIVPVQNAPNDAPTRPLNPRQKRAWS
jgi:hypothetical protein